MSLFAHNKGNYDPVTTAAIRAANQKQSAVPPSTNAGNVYKIFLPYNVNGSSSPQQYVPISVTGNSFKLLDAPSSVIIKSDIFADQIFQERTGQTFGQNFTSLQLKMNAASSNPLLWTQGTYSGIFGVGIYVTIWVGNSNETGYWDGRTQPARNSYEMIIPIQSSSPGNFLTVSANSTLPIFIPPYKNSSSPEDVY